MGDRQLKTIELTPHKKRLIPGDRVQLGFCKNNTGIVHEHLWVRIFAAPRGKFYFGTVETDAASIDGLKIGDQIKMV